MTRSLPSPRCGHPAFTPLAATRSSQPMGDRNDFVVCIRAPCPRRSLLLFALCSRPRCERSAARDGFAGKRFFPATLVTDDPFVADELSLPTRFRSRSFRRAAKSRRRARPPSRSTSRSASTDKLRHRLRRDLSPAAARRRRQAARVRQSGRRASSTSSTRTTSARRSCRRAWTADIGGTGVEARRPLNRSARSRRRCSSARDSAICPRTLEIPAAAWLVTGQLVASASRRAARTTDQRRGRGERRAAIRTSLAMGFLDPVQPASICSRS